MEEEKAFKQIKITYTEKRKVLLTIIRKPTWKTGEVYIFALNEGIEGDQVLVSSKEMAQICKEYSQYTGNPWTYPEQGKPETFPEIETEV